MRQRLLSDFYYNFLKSNFIKNSLFLLISQLIAKILPLISLFFAVKLYSAEDFGKFGVFVSIATIASSFANLALENVIVLSKEKQDLRLGIFSCTIWAIIFLLIQTIVAIVIYYFFFTEGYILLIGLFSFIKSFALITTNLAIKLNFIKQLSISKIFDSIIFNSLFIILGIYGYGYKGLIFCSFVTLLPSILTPGFYCIRKLNFTFPSIAEITDFHKRYIDIIKYIAPANFIEVLNNNLHIIIFNSLFNSTIVGQLFFVQRILISPIFIIQPIVQYLLKTIHITNNLDKYYNYITYFIYLYITAGFVFSITIISFPTNLLHSHIKTDWLLIFHIFQIMLPWYLYSYLLKILLPIFFRSSKHYSILNYNLISLLATIATGIGGYLFALEFTFQLLWLSVFKIVVCLYFIIKILIITKNL